MSNFNFKPVITENELDEYLNYGLDEKIDLSLSIINHFCNENPIEQIFISSSFGKDSIVLVDLVRQQFPEIPIVYLDTGIDPECCRELANAYENVIKLYPKKDIEQVTHEYGYMIPQGKDKASAIEQVRRNLYQEKYDTWRVKQMRGERKGAMWDYSDCCSILVAPFKISDRCCYHLKLSPLRTFKNQTKYNYSFNGVTTEESQHRKNAILKNGFINKTVCSPIAHWTANDVLQYIKENNLPLASCYGEIIEDDMGNLKTSLFQRTGCLCCPVGSQHESPNKFQLLREFDKDTWEYIIYDLGYGQVLDFFNIPYTLDL